MYPSFYIFGHEITTYSICAGVGMIAVAIYMWIKVRKTDRYDVTQLINIAVVSGIGTFLGAHLLFAFTQWELLIEGFQHPDIIFKSPEVFLHFLVLVFGGMVFYGGLIGGLLTGVVYVKTLKHIKLDPYLYADLFAPAIALFHAFGRVGCFLGGCCYGIECKVGFVYHYAPVPEANGVTRLPIQLIESAGDIVIFIILLILGKKKNLPKGTLIITYLILYPIMRFVNEFFRGDVIRGFALGLSTSQWFSIGMILFSIGFIIYRKLKSPKEEEKAEEKAE